jgi:hypothetical protein
MNYSIPATAQEVVALRQQPINGELVVAAIAGVVTIARSQGQSLEDLTAELLAEDTWLDAGQRLWLSSVVTETWQYL